MPVLGHLVYQQLAVMYQLAFCLTEAREHLEQALRSGPLDNLTGVAMLAEPAYSSRTLE